MSRRPVTERRAPPEVARLFHDIVQVLRTTGIDPAFERWASHPRFLEAAWSAVRDDAETVLFERAAGRLQASALTYAARFGRLGVFGNLELGESRGWQLHAALDLAVDVKPKILLIAAAIGLSLDGMLVGRGASAGVAERVERGAPPERVALEMVPDSPLEPELRALLERIRRVRGGGDIYRVLALWPDYLAHAWLELERLRGVEAWRDGIGAILALARELVQDLPYGVALSARTVTEELGEDAAAMRALVAAIERDAAEALLEAGTALVDVAGLAVTARLRLEEPRA